MTKPRTQMPVDLTIVPYVFPGLLVHGFYFTFPHCCRHKLRILKKPILFVLNNTLFLFYFPIILLYNIILDNPIGDNTNWVCSKYLCIWGFETHYTFYCYYFDTQTARRRCLRFEIVHPNWMVMCLYYYLGVCILFFITNKSLRFGKNKAVKNSGKTGWKSTVMCFGVVCIKLF